MRADRFESWLVDCLQAAGGPEVTTFAAAGYAARPLGVVLALPSGASVYVQIVRGSPPDGSDRRDPEPIVTGEPAAVLPPSPGGSARSCARSSGIRGLGIWGRKPSGTAYMSHAIPARISIYYSRTLSAPGIPRIRGMHSSNSSPFRSRNALYPPVPRRLRQLPRLRGLRRHQHCYTPAPADGRPRDVLRRG